MEQKFSYNFRSRFGWINDPNGLFYLNGEYHLFFQHHPDSTVWGPMHWGHATSRDLVSWTEHPIALKPDSRGMIFSGSVVVDHDNTFGLSNGGAPTLIAFFTQHDPRLQETGAKNFQRQSAAISRDDGKSWQMLSANPILPNPGNLNDFRDPFVFWHDASRAWIMLLAAGDCMHVYRADAIESWTLVREFRSPGATPGSIVECPVICQIPVIGENRTKWVLIQSYFPGGRYGGSGTQYLVGEFDGETFNIDPGFRRLMAAQGPQWLDWGPDHYATNVWANDPGAHNGPLSISWMNNWAYARDTFEAPFRGTLTRPRRHILVPFEGTVIVKSQPACSAPLYEYEQGTETILLRQDVADFHLAGIAREPEPDRRAIRLLGKNGQLAEIRLEDEATYWEIDRSRAKPATSEDLANSLFRFPRLSTDPIPHIEICCSQNGFELFFDHGIQSATFLLDQRTPVTKLHHHGWQIVV